MEGGASEGGKLVMMPVLERTVKSKHESKSWKRAREHLEIVKEKSIDIKFWNNICWGDISKIDTSQLYYYRYFFEQPLL